MILNTNIQSIDDRIREDLTASGLVPEDLNARVLENPERAACGLLVNVLGYVIPYYDLNSKQLPHYRVKCFDNQPKYKQPRATANYVYFPKGVQALALQKKYIIITEGEKKAAKAVKEGFPCIAFGGVDSWRSRTILLPKEVEISQKGSGEKQRLQATVKNGSGDEDGDFNESEGLLAQGFLPLVDFIVSNKLTVIICYDSDRPSNGGNWTTKFEVQRAAATLGFELRFRGVSYTNIKQLVLQPQETIVTNLSLQTEFFSGSKPAVGTRPTQVPGQHVLETYVHSKLGLDDLLVHFGKNVLASQITYTISNPVAFPRHPNIRDYVNKKLMKPKLNRRESQQLALALLCELDANGKRLRSDSEDNMYYFDNTSKKLMKASLHKLHNDIIVNSEFARFLYQEYGLATNDNRVLSWLATQFTSEQPIFKVNPKQVITVRGDDIYFQINDGQYIKTNKEGHKVLDNGTDSVLFQGGKVKEINAQSLIDEIKRQDTLEFTPYWLETLKEVRLRFQDHSATLFGLIFYLSPWFLRWRGTQLPIELIIGEAGSGKSSLYQMRLAIICGDQTLRNPPQDMKDWYASATSTGGLHVTDNVQLVDRNMRQRLSDELCRIVTEPEPHIEQRKYFTNTDLVRLPIHSVFAITAIQQPFHNADLIQRAVVIQLDKGDGDVTYNSSWSNDQITKRGGRIAWVAHQLIVARRFLQLVNKEWDPKYKAKHRLVNLEQSLILMAKAVGIDGSWIPKFLTELTTELVSENDWALRGLKEFAMLFKGTKKRFGVSEISDWAQGEEDYSMCNQLINSHSLGRYIQSHKNTVAMSTGIKESGKQNNRTMYEVN